MEGGCGSFAINNIPSSAVVRDVLNGSERAYDYSSPNRPDMASSVATSTILSTNNAASATVVRKDHNDANAAVTIAEKEGSTSTKISGEGEDAPGTSACSSSVETSRSIEMSGSDTPAVASAECPVTANATEPGFPAVGSPSADLMVVNTNGFNPLQHAALRGNPG